MSFSECCMKEIDIYDINDYLINATYWSISSSSVSLNLLNFVHHLH